MPQADVNASLPPSCLLSSHFSCRWIGCALDMHLACICRPKPAVVVIVLDTFDDNLLMCQFYTQALAVQRLSGSPLQRNGFSDHPPYPIK